VLFSYPLVIFSHHDNTWRYCWFFVCCRDAAHGHENAIPTYNHSAYKLYGAWVREARQYPNGSLMLFQMWNMETWKYSWIHHILFALSSRHSYHVMPSFRTDVNDKVVFYVNRS
jgi:hypothetical protein